ncbi:MAG: hypothetical protein ACU841_11580 [Gammaproteobacteria bacterium]
MALDKLRVSLNMVETCLNERTFEQASHVGYQDVAHNFVYLQRTLAGLQSASHRKDEIISEIARRANMAYEDVLPYVDDKMRSSVKKTNQV